MNPGLKNHQSQVLTPNRTSATKPLAGVENLRILVNSWPKAGTQLLLELVRHTLGDGPWMRDRDIKSPLGDAGFLAGVDERIRLHQPRFAIKGHIPWSPEIESGLAERDIRVLLIVRDLRDVACSTLRWMRDLSPDWPASRALLKYPTDDERLTQILSGLTRAHPFDLDSGINWSAPLPARYSRLTEWADHLEPGAVVRYEDLLGANGRMQQRSAIVGALESLGVRTDRATIECIVRSVFNPEAITFHTGSTGGWMNDFNDEHRRLFIALGGDEINSIFGYSTTQD